MKCRQVLDCGGKRSATPLSDATGAVEKLRRRFALPEQSKPLRDCHPPSSILNPRVFIMASFLFADLLRLWFMLSSSKGLKHKRPKTNAPSHNETQ
jgi:hypothetical protein